MTSYFAFLRGINVGPAKRVVMRDLQAIVEGLGHADVSTYLQSGNVAFASGDNSEAKLAAGITEAIKGRLGLDVGVVVRSRSEVERLVIENPLADAEKEPAKLHLVLLPGEVDKAKLAGIDVAAFEPELVRAGRRALYVFYAAGVHRSKLGPALTPVAGPTGTARNWNTITKLLARTG